MLFNIKKIKLGSIIKNKFKNKIKDINNFMEDLLSLVFKNFHRNSLSLEFPIEKVIILR